MTDDTTATVTTSVTSTASTAVPPHPVALTPSEITGLIGVFQTMLKDAIQTVLDKLDENAKAAAGRWSQHERDHAETERRLSTLETSVQAHLQLAHDAKVASDARIKPLRGSLAWLWAQRRDIVIVLIGLGVLAKFVVDALGHAIGASL